MPQAVQQALAAIGDEQASLESCARHIERDLGLAVKMLKIANSAFFGVSGRVATVHDALNILGLRMVTMLLTSATMSSTFGDVRCPGFEFRSYWRHSLGAGMAARALAARCGVDPALAFTAGLLHDVGRLALAMLYPSEQAAALAWSKRADRPPGEGEQCLFGLGHDAIGADIARQWRFPAVVVEAIAAHHVGGQGRSAVADVVHVADAIAHALELSPDDGGHVPMIDVAAWVRVDPGLEAMLGILSEVESGVTELCLLFDL